MKNNKKIVVLNHKGCRDGFGAAWAAWRKFGARAEYIGIFHDDPIPHGLKDKNVYMLDISFDIAKTRKILNIASRLTIIDHHISAELSIKLADEYVYALDHSGAILSWRHFHPDKRIPVLSKHIEDIDIWKFKLSHTKELMASLETYDLDFKLWNQLAKDWENKKNRKKYLNEGAAIVKYQDSLVKKAMKDSEEVRFFGKKALAVNFTLALNSEIGEAIRRKGYELGIIWQKKGDKLIVSLRSTSKVDSSKIAARFGGGGHKKAAAFRLPAKIKFPWKRTKK